MSEITKVTVHFSRSRSHVAHRSIWWIETYGFAIHGAIDGFSRKIIWLSVSSSNNNPAYIAIACYFIQSVTELGRNLQVIQGDRGSGNITLCGIKRFLRRNFSESFSGYDSFHYGSSTSNQWIEAWWSQFIKANGTWWINFFKSLIDSNIYSINYHVEIMRFCFMLIMHQELDEMKWMWNTQCIGEVRNSKWPPGQLNILYFMPEESGRRSFRFPVNEIDINSCHPFCELPDVNNCTNETHELVRLIMREGELEFPSNATEAKKKKKKNYFHHKKHRIKTTLILRVFIIRTTQTLYCNDILLMER